MDDLLLYFICGFIASLIDGSIGMAYGVSLTTILTTMGVPILNASSTIHFCEIFTSFASGVSHFVNGNVDLNLLKRIMIPGILGGFWGALLLIYASNYNLKPYVAGYLLILGIVILIKVFRNKTMNSDNKGLIPLGFVGGFFDATGGGGWGPIVTSSLIVQGHTPAKVVGTVNLAEFFVTVVQVAVFFTVVKFVSWQMALGFVLGGCIAAPLSAIFVKKINSRILMVLVAITLIIINLFVIVQSLGKG